MGKKAQVNRWDEYYIEVYYTYSPVTTFNTIELSNVTTPAADAAPDWKCDAADSAKYYLTSPFFSSMGSQTIAWYEGAEKLTAKDLENIVTMSGGISYLINLCNNLHFESGLNYLNGTKDNPLESFQLGKTYSFVALVYAKEGFSYSAKTTATINGKKAEVFIDPSMVCAFVTYGYDPAEYPVQIKSASLSKTVLAYTGKTLTPGIVVKGADGKVLEKNVDYVVKYRGKKVGKGTATVTGKGAYFGTITKTFTINPPSTSIKKVQAASKAATVVWSKKTKQVNGYQISYSTSKKFSKKTTKTTKVTSAKIASKQIKKLKSKKKYHFKVRTYKKVGSKTYYSAWSKTKSATIK